MLRSWQLKIALCLAVALCSLVVHIARVEISPVFSVIVYGSGIVAAAFLLTWGAEAAEADISAGLAIALLALIAVLPEYAVDLYFAYVSGNEPIYEQYAAANMTGSNRLLLGLGWPTVAFLYWLGMKRVKRPTSGVRLELRRRVELGFLAVASVYCFLIPVTRRLTLIDAVVLLSLFAVYMVIVASEERREPEFIGVAASLSRLPRRRRRAVVTFLFVSAAVFVLNAAEPFSRALVATGDQLGIDEFLLVQWLAPLASEAPEFIVAALWALKCRCDSALGTLLSSKVNQWTLLVGSIPLAHMVGGGGLALGLDARQTEEFLLTAAQTVLGFAVLANLRFDMKEASLLFVLFALQFPFPQTEVRIFFSLAYLVIAGGLLIFHRGSLRPVFGSMRRGGWRAYPASEGDSCTPEGIDDSSAAGERNEPSLEVTRNDD